jgi:hypothetical protein
MRYGRLGGSAGSEAHRRSSIDDAMVSCPIQWPLLRVPERPGLVWSGLASPYHSLMLPPPTTMYCIELHCIELPCITLRCITLPTAYKHIHGIRMTPLTFSINLTSTDFLLHYNDNDVIVGARDILRTVPLSLFRATEENSAPHADADPNEEDERKCHRVFSKAVSWYVDLKRYTSLFISENCIYWTREVSKRPGCGFGNIFNLFDARHDDDALLRRCVFYYT